MWVHYCVGLTSSGRTLIGVYSASQKCQRSYPVLQRLEPVQYFGVFPGLGFPSLASSWALWQGRGANTVRVARYCEQNCGHRQRELSRLPQATGSLGRCTKLPKRQFSWGLPLALRHLPSHGPRQFSLALSLLSPDAPLQAGLKCTIHYIASTAAKLAL